MARLETSPNLSPQAPHPSVELVQCFPIFTIFSYIFLYRYLIFELFFPNWTFFNIRKVDLVRNVFGLQYMEMEFHQN